MSESSVNFRKLKIEMIARGVAVLFSDTFRTEILEKFITLPVFVERDLIRQFIQQGMLLFKFSSGSAG